jgi:hypothetical protein
MVLKDRPGDPREPQSRFGGLQPVTVEVPPNLATEITDRDARPGQFSGESGKQFFKDLLTPGEEPVGVAALRYAAARLAHSVQLVPVDDYDVRVSVGEDPSDKHPGHAPAKYHRTTSGETLGNCIRRERNRRSAGHGRDGIAFRASGERQCDQACLQSPPV